MILYCFIYITMGEISIGKSLGTICNTLLESATNSFRPKLLQIYASGNTETLVSEFKKAMKTTGMISNIIFTGFVVCGRDLFRLWLPTQNAEFLYIIAIIVLMSDRKGKRFFLFEEQIFGIFFWYSICYWIINRFPKVLNNRILKLINMYSMDIYLYGVPVNYIIMTMLIHIDDATHMNNITSLFLYVLRIFMQIIVGIAM